MDAEGLDRVDVVGNSVGGIVAQVVASTVPERVRRLVLVGTGASTQGALPGFAQAVDRWIDTGRDGGAASRAARRGHRRDAVHRPPRRTRLGDLRPSGPAHGPGIHGGRPRSGAEARPDPAAVPHHRADARGSRQRGLRAHRGTRGRTRRGNSLGPLRRPRLQLSGGGRSRPRCARYRRTGRVTPRSSRRRPGPGRCR
ncbi:alpha/beta fold hydrolase [Streptomyces flaveolus]|uniref:alpha/beta fold hydrolase n=1 Tax=Streptomyces flaveolus TaxID=67297 RepID=UPI0034072023